MIGVVLGLIIMLPVSSCHLAVDMPELSTDGAPLQILQILQPCSERWKGKLHRTMGKACRPDKKGILVTIMVDFI